MKTESDSKKKTELKEPEDASAKERLLAVSGNTENSEKCTNNGIDSNNDKPSEEAKNESKVNKEKKSKKKKSKKKKKKSHKKKSHKHKHKQ